MSRLWRDQYCVALGLDRLAAMRRRKGLRTAVDLKRSEAFVPLPGVPAWRGAADACGRFLSSPEVAAGDLKIVLSNHFVRYLVVPWSGQITTMQEFRNYAVAAFEDVYGDTVAGWEVSVSPEGHGAPRLAAAVDRALLDALREAASRSRLRLRSIQPYLMSAYNRIVRPLRDKNFVFMLIEADRVCLLTAENKTWRQVSAVTVSSDPVGLAALLEREIHMADLRESAVPSIYIHGAHQPDVLLAPVQGRAPRILELSSTSGRLPTGDAAFAMAATLV